MYTKYADFIYIYNIWNVFFLKLQYNLLLITYRLLTSCPLFYKHILFLIRNESRPVTCILYLQAQSTNTLQTNTTQPTGYSLGSVSSPLGVCNLENGMQSSTSVSHEVYLMLIVRS